MRRIAIVGAGQSGLQLAFALLDQGYHVTLATNRDAEQIRTGKVMSSQCMFHTSLQIERDLGLNTWEEACPSVEGIGIAVPHPDGNGRKVIDWSSRLTRYAQSVDQRVKMADWLDRVKRRGADVRIADIGVPELEELARSHDLVLLAAGKGEIVNLLGRDDTRSAFDRPQRALALTYVKGMTPSQPYSRVRFNLLPGIGEYFVFPALTTTACEIMVFEGIPGGPLDCWADVKTPDQHLDRSLSFLQQYVPWEFERCRDVELTDPNGTLAGRFTPTVRKPFFRLPSGRTVFGMADAVVVNDPITGQDRTTPRNARKRISTRSSHAMPHRSAKTGCSRRSKGTGPMRSTSCAGPTRCSRRHRRTSSNCSARPASCRRSPRRSSTASTIRAGSRRGGSSRRPARR